MYIPSPLWPQCVFASRSHSSPAQARSITAPAVMDCCALHRLHWTRWRIVSAYCRRSEGTGPGDIDRARQRPCEWERQTHTEARYKKLAVESAIANAQESVGWAVRCRRQTAGYGNTSHKKKRETWKGVSIELHGHSGLYNWMIELNFACFFFFPLGTGKKKKKNYDKILHQSWLWVVLFLGPPSLLFPSLDEIVAFKQGGLQWELIYHTNPISANKM